MKIIIIIFFLALTPNLLKQFIIPLEKGAGISYHIERERC